MIDKIDKFVLEISTRLIAQSQPKMDGFVR